MQRSGNDFERSVLFLTFMWVPQIQLRLAGLYTKCLVYTEPSPRLQVSLFLSHLPIGII